MMYAELFKIYWPGWNQFTKFLRWILPLILHVTNFSVIAFGKIKSPVLQKDFASIVFAAATSLQLLRFGSLIPIPHYKPSSRYTTTLLEVFLQIIFVDLSIRFIAIPSEYILHCACLKGYVAYFIENYLFFLYIFDEYIHLSKLVRISRTYEGYQYTRLAISYIQLIIGIFSTGLYLRIYALSLRIKGYVENIIRPVYNVVSSTNRIKRKRKRNCWLF